MDQISISKQAKKLANLVGVKTRIKTSGSVYVTFLSEPTNELVSTILALSTSVAHGDLMDDTRWYSGQAVYIRYQYEIPAETMAQFNAIKSQYGDLGYHFEQAIKNEMGFRGQAVLDQVRY